ncbi:MAG: methylenetetrahydrofolate reductase, partial [bacterium]
GMRDEKIFECGEEIRNSKKSDILEPRMFLGVAANPFADPFEFRVIRLAKKIKAGADFVQTQCIFDLPKFKQWMKMIVDRGLHEKVYILAGVMPIKSYRVLQYMKNNVAGMSIPDDLIQRMKGAEDPKAEGVEVCCEMIRQLREIPGIHGVHIMAVEWEEIVPAIVQKAGLSPRPQIQ